MKTLVLELEPALLYRAEREAQRLDMPLDEYIANALERTIMDVEFMERLKGEL